MKKQLIIYALILMNCIAHAQVKVVNDLKYEPTGTDELHRIDSMFHLDSSYDFQLRFFVRISTAKADVFILSLKNNIWSARFFEGVRYAPLFNEIQFPLDSVAYLWKSLKDNNVLTLPDAETLKDARGKTLHVSMHHGTWFTFDLITKKNKRSYTYHCPNHYVVDFPNVKAYSKVVKMIELIYSFCGVKFRIC